MSSVFVLCCVALSCFESSRGFCMDFVISWLVYYTSLYLVVIWWVFLWWPLSCICLGLWWLFSSPDSKQGRKPGIYLTWSECEEQIKGLVPSILISHLPCLVLSLIYLLCFALTCLVLSYLSLVSSLVYLFRFVSYLYCLASHLSCLVLSCPSLVSSLVLSCKGCANEYKSFNTKEEAEAYLGLSGPSWDCLVLWLYIVWLSCLS